MCAGVLGSQMDPEFRDVRPAGQVDLNRMGGARFLIELADAFADLVGGDADDGIFASVVVVRAFKNADSDSTFFELAGIAGKGLQNDMGKEALAAGALSEIGSGEHLFELSFDGILNFITEQNVIRFRNFGIQHEAVCLRPLTLQANAGMVAQDGLNS